MKDINELIPNQYGAKTWPWTWTWVRDGAWANHDEVIL